MKRLASLFVAGLVAMSAAPAFAQAGPGYGYGYGRMWNDGWGHGWGHGWFLGPVLMVLLVIAAIFLIVALWRWGHHGYYGHGVCPRCGFGHHHGHNYRRSALDTLEERFAKGEIDTKEFEEKRKLLQQ